MGLFSELLVFKNAFRSASRLGSNTLKKPNTLKKSNTFKKPVEEKSKQTRKASPLLKRLLHIRTVSHSNITGKHRQTYALVIVGDGNGSAGFGEARNDDFGLAVRNAELNAIKNMIKIDRLDNRTIFNDTESQLVNTRVKLWNAAAGNGVVSSSHIREICYCFGIHDLAAKIYGSTNPMNVIKATFQALKSTKKPSELALLRGKRLYDVCDTYYGNPIVKEK